MARLIESNLWLDFTRKKSPPALKSLIHPWILDPEATLDEVLEYEAGGDRPESEQKLNDIREVLNSVPPLAELKYGIDWNNPSLTLEGKIENRGSRGHPEWVLLKRENSAKEALSLVNEKGRSNA